MRWALRPLITHSRNYYLGVNSFWGYDVSNNLHLRFCEVTCMFVSVLLKMSRISRKVQYFISLHFSQPFPKPYNFLCAIQSDMKLKCILIFNLYILLVHKLFANVRYNEVLYKLIISQHILLMSIYWLYTVSFFLWPLSMEMQQIWQHKCTFNWKIFNIWIRHQMHPTVSGNFNDTAYYN